jgi:hypothetical protein
MLAMLHLLGTFVTNLFKSRRRLKVEIFSLIARIRADRIFGSDRPSLAASLRRDDGNGHSHPTR